MNKDDEPALLISLLELDMSVAIKKLQLVLRKCVIEEPFTVYLGKKGMFCREQGMYCKLEFELQAVHETSAHTKPTFS